MDKIDEKRFFTMAESYDKMSHILVPHYDFLQDEMIKILSIENYPNPTVVDLGAGSGTFLEKILKKNASAICYWVDYSQDFLNAAKDKLSRFEGRVKFIHSPIEESWDSPIEKKPDFILSMSSIHHLKSEEKKALYKKCFDLLSNDGWFVNIDEMKTIYNDAYANSLHHWVKHVEESKAQVQKDKMDLYHKWKAHFDKWKVRNVDNIDTPKSKGDDIHESFVNQLEWLKEIGFIHVDVFLKHHLWCAIGGQKKIE